MRICYYPNFETLQINREIEKGQVMIEVPLQSKSFGFDGTLSVADSAGREIQKRLSVCVDNSKDLLLQSSRGVFQILARKICRDPFVCAREEDLLDFNDLDTAFEIRAEGSFVGAAPGDRAKGAWVCYSAGPKANAKEWASWSLCRFGSGNCTQGSPAAKSS